MALKDRFKNIPLPEIVEEDESDIKEEAEQVKEEALGRQVFDDLVKKLAEKISSIPVWFEYTRDEQYTLISSYVSTKLKELGVELSDEEKKWFIELFINSVFGFGEIDVLILREDVSVIFVNDTGIVEIEKAGNIELSDIIISEEQFGKIKDVMLKLAEQDTNSGIVNLRLRNLMITILQPPVCAAKIIIRKLARTTIDFEYLVSAGMLNTNTVEMIKTLLSEKRNILITGTMNCGKSALISAMLNELKGIRSFLFQKFPLIDAPEAPAQSFLTGTLDDEEFDSLISAVSLMSPSYVFADLNSAKFTDAVVSALPALKGFVAALRADSVVSAVSKLASSIVSSEKCTEKAAKAAIARTFDYIFFIQNGCLNTMVSLSLNKAGSLVMTQVPIPQEVQVPEVQAEPQPEAQMQVAEVSSQSAAAGEPEAPAPKVYSSFRSRYQ